MGDAVRRAHDLRSCGIAARIADGDRRALRCGAWLAAWPRRCSINRASRPSLGILLRDGRQRRREGASAGSKPSSCSTELVRARRRMSPKLRGLRRGLSPGPLTFANGLATDRGARRARPLRQMRVSPAVRRAIASSLYVWNRATARAARGRLSAAGRTCSLCVRAMRLWPRPHGRLFDFDATQAAARRRLTRLRRWPREQLCAQCGPLRARPRRLACRASASLGWSRRARIRLAEPLPLPRRPRSLASPRTRFAPDWSGNDPRQAPSLEEARTFVADYERARGDAVRPRGAETMRRSVRVLGGLHRSLRSCGRLRRPRCAGHLPSSARHARRRAAETLTPTT